MHDDVIDHDTVRRGIPNVAGEFRLRGHRSGADAAGAALLGEAAAILAGDLLLHEAFRMVALADIETTTRGRLFDLLDDAVFVSAAGELADVENSVAGDVAEPGAILDATFNKTAVYSFSAPLEAGAVLAGAPRRGALVLHGAGGRLGLAYQLVDDLIGAFGSNAQAGREAGGDLREVEADPARRARPRDARVAACQRRPRRSPTPGRSRCARRSSRSRRAERACACGTSSTRPSTRCARHRTTAISPPPRATSARRSADGIEGRDPVTRTRAAEREPTGLALYDRTAQDAAATVIAAYSTSFGLACRLLGPASRPHVRNVYALVRIADEIVDGPAARRRTRRPRRPGACSTTSRPRRSPAIDRGFSANLVVHAFARTARECGIDGGPRRARSSRPCAPTSRRTRHDDASHDAYVYGSAEVVGLMCLQVFVNAGAPHPIAPRAQLVDGARRLGARSRTSTSSATSSTMRPRSAATTSASTSDATTRDGVLDRIDADLAAAAARSSAACRRDCRRAVTRGPRPLRRALGAPARRSGAAASGCASPMPSRRASPRARGSASRHATREARA